MWNNKLKAVTFSFDDGVTQDIKLIDILDKYGLKSTFNLNSSLLGLNGTLSRESFSVSHNIVPANKVANIYKNHEVAVHTLTHPNLTTLNEDAIIWQAEKDRQVLSDLTGYEIVGMAYPCGGVNNDDRVAKIIKDNTKIKYSRTITSTNNFDLQSNLFRFNPSIYYIDTEKLFELARQFIELKTNTLKIFYIWGHSYEIDYTKMNYALFEEFCKLISNQKDIFYGTNREVLLNN